GLPTRLCQMVEYQQAPEFMPPDLVPAEYRREVGVFYFAHVLESFFLCLGSFDSGIYIKDYMGFFCVGGMSVDGLLNRRIIPSLKRNLQRLPQSVQALIRPALDGQRASAFRPRSS